MKLGLVSCVRRKENGGIAGETTLADVAEAVDKSSDLDLVLFSGWTHGPTITARCSRETAMLGRFS